MQSGLSVVIITRNEEKCIARAIGSVSAIAGEIIVVDSESEDATREIASRLGAKVYVKPWVGWVRQKNYGAELTSNDWILSIDADEIVTPALARQIANAVAGGLDPRGGLAFDRQEEFLGVTMCSSRRNKIRRRFVRVYNRRFSAWDESMLIHEGILCDGAITFLDAELIHWRNYTIGEQMRTLNKNAEFEAQEIALSNKLGVIHIPLLFKPLLRFLWVYIACGNWRLGMRGYLWAMMNAAGEFLRHAKAWELRNAPRRPEPPPPLYQQNSSTCSD